MTACCVIEMLPPPRLALEALTKRVSEKGQKALSCCCLRLSTSPWNDLEGTRQLGEIAGQGASAPINRFSVLAGRFIAQG